MRRSIRYQAAIVSDNHLLLLKVLDGRTGRLLWVFPGGGREPGENEEECLEREVREETHLTVAVARCLTCQKAITRGYEPIFARFRNLGSDGARA